MAVPGGLSLAGGQGMAALPAGVGGLSLGGGVATGGLVGLSAPSVGLQQAGGVTSGLAQAGGRLAGLSAPSVGLQQSVGVTSLLQGGLGGLNLGLLQSAGGVGMLQGGLNLGLLQSAAGGANLVVLPQGGLAQLQPAAAQPATTLQSLLSALQMQPTATTLALAQPPAATTGTAVTSAPDTAAAAPELMAPPTPGSESPPAGAPSAAATSPPSALGGILSTSAAAPLLQGLTLQAPAPQPIQLLLASPGATASTSAASLLQGATLLINGTPVTLQAALPTPTLPPPVTAPAPTAAAAAVGLAEAYQALAQVQATVQSLEKMDLDESAMSHAEYQYAKYAKELALQQQVTLTQQLTAALATAVGLPQMGAAPTATTIAHDPSRVFTGAVRSWDKERCFGFVNCAEAKQIYGKDVFLHQSEMVFESEHLKQRQKIQIDDGEVVTFRVEMEKGKPRAVGVKFARDLLQLQVLEAQIDGEEPASKKRRLLAGEAA